MKLFFAFVSLFFPGVIQISSGQSLKGLIIYLSYFIIAFVVSYTRVVTELSGLIVFILLVILISFYSLLDYIKNREEYSNSLKKIYNKIKLILLFISQIILYIAFNYYNLVGLSLFVVSGHSHNPTINIDKLIIVDTKAYEAVSQIPYGDLVVYKIVDGTHLLGRVLGLPGDSIEIRQNRVFRNGESNSTFIKDTIIRNNHFSLFQEKLTIGRSYRFIIEPEFKDFITANKKTTYISKDCYYIVTDNRSGKTDSRLLGEVEKERIIGKVLFSIKGETIK